jgi:GTPase SAR1 family protein
MERSKGNGKKIRRVKMLVVGDSYSGKTALLKAICKVPFVANYSPTVCESMIARTRDGKKEVSQKPKLEFKIDF